MAALHTSGDASTSSACEDVRQVLARLCETLQVCLCCFVESPRRRGQCVGLQLREAVIPPPQPQCPKPFSLDDVDTDSSRSGSSESDESRWLGWVVVPDPAEGARRRPNMDGLDMV